jgi:hypothetical protein
MSAHRSELRILDRRARNAHRRKMNPARIENRATMEQVASVLCELRDLLDDYAPAWYSAEQHSRVESAIQRLSRR